MWKVCLGAKHRVRLEEAPMPITIGTLPRLAWRTAMADRSHYRSSGRRTAIDFLASIRPTLRDPVFIVGAPRSGTTFLGRCVEAVSGISYHFEPIATKAAARYVYHQRWSPRSARLFYRTVYGWLLRIHLDGRMRFAEKTPRNCFIIDSLHRSFPDARFVFIVRDGRDAALSHREKPWLRSTSAGSGRREPFGYSYGPFPRFWVESGRREEFRETSDLHRCIWCWRRHNEAAVEALGNLSGAFALTVRYEELVRDPDRESRRILDFLGIQHSDARDRFQIQARTASTRSIARWRSELSPDEGLLVEREAGVMLRHFGYLRASRVE